MGRLRAAWSSYWFAPAPLVNLSMCRIVIAGFQLQSLLGWGHGRLARQASLPDFLYDPLPVLHALVWPLGWTYRPGLDVLEAIYGLALVTGALAVVGLFTRLSLALFAVASVFLQAHAYSFGDFHHPEGVVLIALSVLALSPAGEVLSLDQLWRARLGSGRSAHDLESLLSAENDYARWPLLVIGWVLSLAYLSGAVSKLQAAGLDWMNGTTLRYYLAQDGLRWNRQLGVWLAQQQHLVQALSWGTIVFEGTFVLVLFVPALAVIYLPVGASLHVGIDLAMAAPFYGWIALYSVFVPWDRMGRGLRRRLSGSGAPT